MLRNLIIQKSLRSFRSFPHLRVRTPLTLRTPLIQSKRTMAGHDNFPIDQYDPRDKTKLPLHINFDQAFQGGPETYPDYDPIKCTFHLFLWFGFLGLWAYLFSLTYNDNSPAGEREYPFPIMSKEEYKETVRKQKKKFDKLIEN
jgi:hypothetical protein